LPRAALLGSIGGAGLALIALLPMLKMYADPIPGLLAFGVVLVSLVGKVKIPGKIPGALASALVGIAAFQLLRAVHIMSPLVAAPTTGSSAAFHFAFPWPTVAFLGGLSLAWVYLPIILPFSLSTVVGGIDNTESAAAAGDVYDTRAILLTEGFCTLLAGLCGGVVESTPYIGHPAYKAMGAGAGYVILTGLFIGLGGIFGYLPFIVAWVPAAAIAPILVYIGLEVISEAFLATPARHGLAVAVSLLPSVAFLIALEVTAALGAVGAHVTQLTGDVGETVRTVILLGNGFIISALIWGAATAELLDRRFGRSAWCLVVGALACLFGVIHSPAAEGTFVLPWRAGSPLPWHFAFGYLGAASVIFISKFFPNGNSAAQV
jgi:AGZA family xanthine/uracil permease-like MFS transporter